MNKYNLKKKRKHDYTSELELKSLLIRVKNERLGKGTPDLNAKINKYVLWHTKMDQVNHRQTKKLNALKIKVKKAIVKMSETTMSTQHEFERFGTIILLMIRKILTLSNFSKYTFKDEFYSDANYKILRYLNNFDHTLISKRTGTSVNAFAYISQIIHHSVIYIIMKHKKETKKLRNYVSQEQALNNVEVGDVGWSPNDQCTGHSACKITRMFTVNTVDTTLLEEIIVLNDKIKQKPQDALTIKYSNDYDVCETERNQILQIQREINLVPAEV